MRLTNHRGTSLEFRALRYEFPELTRREYDSNWLVISGRIEKDGTGWQFRDPCLLTNEVLSLAEWLESRAHDAMPTSEISFIEPNLYFKWARGILRVDLEQECRPPWAPFDKVDEFYITLSPSPQEMNEAAKALREDLEKFPIRAES
jgi:hypothetical protein